GNAPLSTHGVVADGSQPIPERLSISDVVLRRIRRLGLVAEEIDLRARSARGDESLQTGLREVRRIPLDRAVAALGREAEAIDRELQPEPLVERGVEEEAIVVLAPAAEDDRLAIAAEVVSESQARLPHV